MLIFTYFDEVWLMSEGKVEGAVARGKAEDAGLVIALKAFTRALKQETCIDLSEASIQAHDLC